jgi:hypothetical protein
MLWGIQNPKPTESDGLTPKPQEVQPQNLLFFQQQQQQQTNAHSKHKSKQSRPQLRCGTRLERCERALHPIE